MPTQRSDSQPAARRQGLTAGIGPSVGAVLAVTVTVRLAVFGAAVAVRDGQDHGVRADDG